MFITDIKCIYRKLHAWLYKHYYKFYNFLKICINWCLDMWCFYFFPIIPSDSTLHHLNIEYIYWKKFTTKITNIDVVVILYSLLEKKLKLV